MMLNCTPSLFIFICLYFSPLRTAFILLLLYYFLSPLVNKHFACSFVTVLLNNLNLTHQSRTPAAIFMHSYPYVFMFS